MRRLQPKSVLLNRTSFSAELTFEQILVTVGVNNTTSTQRMTPKKSSRGSQFPLFSFIEQIQELLVQTDHLSSFPTNGKQMQENVNMSINKVKVEQEAVSMLKKIGPKSPFTNENCMSATKISLSFNLVKRTHYSKSQIFVQKFNFDKTPTFSRVFHPNFF